MNPGDIFRKEAIDAQQRPALQGDLLRLPPSWVGRAYRLLLAAALSGALYAICGRIAEYAEGPIIVELDQRSVERARIEGTVSAVQVRPGERVEEGQPLVEMHSALQRAELDRIDRAFDRALLDLLRDPSDRAAARALSALRGERQLAEARVDERTIRASHGGIVSDVLVYEGESLEPGQPAVSILDQDDEVFVTAVLPGRYGPLLSLDAPLFVELAGFSGTQHRATITEIGDAGIGANQVRRALGAEVGGAIAIPEGPSLLVRARLPSRTFTADGRPLLLHHGMIGVGRTKVRSESLLYTLFPAARTWN